MPRILMPTKNERIALWAVLLLVLLVPIIAAANLWYEASSAADYSAHAALRKEIEDQLAAIPIGEPYPSSLSDLRLTYPDGGDTSLLNRFEYRSDGTNCTVSTILRGEKVERSFPEEPRP
jgi:hypothetical protein